ncbi:hypothetical protein ACHQM5_024380 [Ranunculus cassubicifolius]
MAIPWRNNHFNHPSNISRLQTLIFNLQRWKHTIAADGETPQLGEVEHVDSSSNSRSNDVYLDMSNWKVVDSRVYGIYRDKVSLASLKALSLLRRNGFEAYLVGGCVRDLLLRRIPKDFDVITNANLKQIKKQFHRSKVVGNRFPICHVFIKGSMVEVSSFDTVAKVVDGEETISESQKPTFCTKEDFIRWQNCLHRDFTINSLFFDPSANRIYDYANGMRDLKLGKVQTVIPAYVSFKEDCGRILRGLRIAARLGLSFSAETAAAIKDLYMSLLDLDRRRLELEMDNMFSYGAAAPSLSLLKKFEILDILLPFHAAYLSEQGQDQNSWSSSMFLKLFSSMDKLLACDRPCSPSLWVALLAFHMALVNNPQDPLVVWAFSSSLYYGNWEDALEFARGKSNQHFSFLPEMSESCSTISDEQLAEKVHQFASQVTSSISALVEPESLINAMARYPQYTFPNYAYVSPTKGRAVIKLFDIFLKDIESYKGKNNKKEFNIDYLMLKHGHPSEVRFVLGKIIMDTMRSEVVQLDEEKEDLPVKLDSSDVSLSHSERIKKAGRNRKKQVVERSIENSEDQKTCEDQKTNTGLSRLFEENGHKPKSNQQQKPVVKKDHKLSSLFT